MKTDDRQPWELEWNVRINTASSYIKYFALDGLEAQRVQAWALCDNLADWAARHINAALLIANDITSCHGSPSSLALAKAASHLAAIAEHRDAHDLIEVLT